MSLRDEIIELAKSGWFPFQIAEQLRVTPVYVSGVVSAARSQGVDIQKFTIKDARRARGAETYMRVVDYTSNGCQPLEIASILNICVQTVYAKVREARSNGINIPQISRAEAVKRRIPITPEIRRSLEPHALARGLTPIELGERLICVIAENDLVNAVLDDGVSHAQ